MLISIRKSDVVWNYLGIFCALGAKVIWLPFLIHYLSPDLLGLWFVFVSIGGLVDLLDTGFTPTLSHNISYVWSGASDLQRQGVAFSDRNSEPNYALLCGMISTCHAFYLCIALVAAFLMTTFGTIYIKHIAAGYLGWKVYVTWSLYIVSTFINLYIGYYSFVLTGIGDISNKNKSQIFARACFLLLGILGLISGFGILSLAIAELANGTVMRFMCRRCLLKIHGFQEIFAKYKGQKQYSKRHILSQMWPNAWRDGLVTVTAYLTGQATVLICSAFLTLYETGIYSFSMQIINTIMGIACGMFFAYIPAIQSAYATRQKEIMERMYGRSIACYFWMTLLGIIGFMIIGVPVIRFLRSDFVIERGVFIVLAISSYLMQRHRLAAALISTTNRLPYTAGFIFSGVISLIATFIGLYFFQTGLWGLVLTPLVVQSLYNNWKWNLVVNQYFGTTEYRLLSDGSLTLLTKLIKK